MKKMFLVALGVLALVPGFAAQAQTSGGHVERTVWVQAQPGTLIGHGYASSYLTNIRAKTIGKEDPKLRVAIDTLDALGMLEVKGFGLLPAAVSWQTEVPMRTLIEQQTETNLSYGELLLSNSLAAKSGRTFEEIVGLRENTRTWGELMRQLQVSPEIIVTQAGAACQRILTADVRYRRKLQREDDLANGHTPASPNTINR